MNSIAIPKITTIQYKNSIIFAYIITLDIVSIGIFHIVVGNTITASHNTSINFCNIS